jgi:hypothetical protein
MAKGTAGGFLVIDVHPALISCRASASFTSSVMAWMIPE